MMSIFYNEYMKLSKVAKEIVARNIGYRDDTVYNSGVTSFSRVLKYELVELNNTDIILTLRKLYKLRGMDVRNPEKSYETIMRFACKMLNVKASDLTCMWFTTDSSVRTFYGPNVTRYKIPEVGFVASDLGHQGVLIVTRKPYKFEREG